MRLMTVLSVFIGLLLLGGCSTNEDEPVGPNTQETATLKLTVTATETYYLDITSGQTVLVDDYRLDETWDLSIDNLTRIRLNGGSTASGSVASMKVEGVSYTDVTMAPDAIYMPDTQNNLSIGESWYFYDVATHTVNPLDVIYIIQAGDGSYYKFQIIEAIFSSRTDGELSIRIDKISSPTSPEFPEANGRVQYSKVILSATEDVFFSFRQGKTLSIADPPSSNEWDFQTSFVTIHINGGTSGPGQGGAVEFKDTDFDSIFTAPVDGYVSDNGDDVKAIGDKWYTYDFMTHTISVNSCVYIVRTAAGHVAKLEFVKTDFTDQNAGSALIRYHYIEGTSKF